MQEYLFSLFISYFIGSFPTAYLLVKKTSNLDIRSVGSGNVGGRNALEVTGKKSIGILVVIIDIVKGLFAIVLTGFIFSNSPLATTAAMIGSVLGHCYPVWLKFKGGRGLATTAGTFLLTGWMWIGIWLALYFASEKITNNIHQATAIALVASPIAVWFLPELITYSMLLHYYSFNDLFTAGVGVMAICLTRYIVPLKEQYEKNS